MIAVQSVTMGFFRDVQDQRVDFDGERFLTEVDAQFGSPELLSEVRWRLEVLHELSIQTGMEEQFEGLRDRLTRIFAEGGDESYIAGQVRALTHIDSKRGEHIDLRHFLVPERRIYSEAEYRDVLRKKIVNTQMHVVNLTAYYPLEEPNLRSLHLVLQGLASKVRNLTVRTRTLKAIEDNIRETPPFQTYETLKERFLRDWLKRFTGANEQELELLGPAEIQRLILSHLRHQTTQLVRAGVRLMDSDVSEHLGMHDTLEGEFRDEEFWRPANVAVRRGFHEWVLRIVQAAGMVNGHRYAFFQSEADPDTHLLVGLGLQTIPADKDEPIRLVPYLKPFTRKAGYLLEIRRRTLKDRVTYYNELRHYTLPFLFGFDQVPGLEVPPALRDFFNSHY